jgi:hypothetical protein
LEVPHCVKGCDPFRLENRAAQFSEKKKKPKKSTDLIGTARYIEITVSAARLGLLNGIRQNSSQTVPWIGLPGRGGVVYPSNN